MLAQKAQQLGLEVHIYSENADDPAAQVTAFHSQGSKTDHKSLKKFLGRVDVVTFESEFWDGELLLNLSNKDHFYPQPRLMDALADRLSQKKLLQKYKIPTADFCNVETKKDFLKLKKKFPKGFVLKKRLFGYDGNGTSINPTEFIENPAGYIAEALIPFERECAVQVFRNSAGQAQIFPLVETYQKDARCLSVKGPEKHKDLKNLKILNFVSEINFVGTLSFELFDYKNKLIVNEIAPRVHNSGHYSMDALKCDQFEMHVRAGLGLSLPKPKLLSKGFAMWNILGPVRDLIPDSDCAFYWYGKKEFKNGRKLGHLNVLDQSANQALKRAKKYGRKLSL